MKAVVREKKLPFEIKADSSELTISNALSAYEALRQLSKGNNLSDMTLKDINAEIRATRDGKSYTYLFT